ncbi:MAG: PAS domain-containing protein [Betaproteobacteria bacterium]
MLSLIKSTFRRLAASRQEDWRLFFEQAPCGVVVVDSSTGTIQSVNRHFAKLMG